MGLRFGKQLEDVSQDTDELRDLLDGSLDTNEGALDEELARLDGYAADPDPGWEKPKLTDRLLKKDAPSGGAPKPRVGKPSAAVKKDVKAKTAMLLGVGGMAWERRDPHCGGAFIEQVPDVSEALADIICDSPDLVAWFTTSGKYMKWFNLAMALQPVVMTAVAHHVTHALDDEARPANDWSAYGAG